MKFSEKVKNIPLSIRKVILWMVVILLAIVLIYFWTKISLQRFHQAWKPEELEQDLKIPSLKKKIREGIPEFKKLESLLESLSAPRIPEEINSVSSSFPNINE